MAPAPPRPHAVARRRSRRRAARAAAAVLALAATGTVVPVLTSTPTPAAEAAGGAAAGAVGATGPLHAQTVQDPRIDPDLWAVPTDGAEVRAAADRLDATRASLADARARAQSATASLGELGEAEERLSRRLVQAERRGDKAQRRVEAIGEGLRSIVVAEYLAGGTGSPLDPDLDLADFARTGARRTLVNASLDQRIDELARTRLARDEAEELARVTALELDEVRGRITAATEARDRALADEARLVVAEADDVQALADARVTAPVVGTDMTLVVLDAYVKGARQMAELDPACGLHWSLLAGIGRTESRHGTYGGTEVGADGRTLEPILGIPLDGTRSATIRDTDGGLLDGDPVWDRAVGPMQFIPSTWATSGRDGDGDGVADPHNLYDTALAAGAYLCRASTVTDEAGARRALWSYNLSVEYATIVLERADGYRSLGLLPGD